MIPKHEPYPTNFEKKNDPYRALVRSVVYQQLSGKAAGTIHGRLLALFPGKDHPDPRRYSRHTGDVAARAPAFRAKRSPRSSDVSQKRLDGVIPEARALARMSDEDIIERLTAARGVGRWTVEMYLMFTLGRPDVLPIDDLGVRKGAEKLYRREFTPKQLGAYGARWAPHRSAAAWHLWRIADTLTPARSPLKKANTAHKKTAKRPKPAKANSKAKAKARRRAKAQ